MPASLWCDRDLQNCIAIDLAGERLRLSDVPGFDFRAMNASGRFQGSGEDSHAAQYLFTVAVERPKCAAVAAMLAPFSLRQALTAAASCALGRPRLIFPR